MASAWTSQGVASQPRAAVSQAFTFQAWSQTELCVLHAVVRCRGVCSGKRAVQGQLLWQPARSCRPDDWKRNRSHISCIHPVARLGPHPVAAARFGAGYAACVCSIGASASRTNPGDAWQRAAASIGHVPHAMRATPECRLVSRQMGNGNCWVWPSVTVLKALPHGLLSCG